MKKRVHRAFGIDGSVCPHGQSARQFTYLARCGMTPPRSACSATINATRLRRNEREAGSIGPGKAADPVAAACDPIQHIDCLWQLHCVIKAGLPVTTN